MSWLARAMPDFLGIGAQRAGTTWLWVHLRRHPRIWTPRRKELHFFDRAQNPGGFGGRLRYAARFLPGRLLGRVVGEVTPAYAALPDDRVDVIASWMPDVRILYVMRDPVDRAWSQAAKGFPRWAGRPVEQANREELLSFLQLPDVISRGDYASALKRWRRFFPVDQILVLVSEQMFADPVAQLRAVYAFVGVDPSAAALEHADVRGRVHAGRSVPMPPWVREALAPQLYAQREELESLLQRPLPWGR